jgi:hypothetical protein
VKFSVTHEFAASPGEVIAVLCDPEFHTHLDLPDLSRPEVVEADTDAPVRVLVLRYEFVGHLDAVAKKLLGNRKLTWRQELRMDTTTASGTLSFAAEADPNKLSGDATVVLEKKGDGTTRGIDGELRVRVPLIGGTAEKRIVPGLVRRLGVEAAALASRIAGPG